MASLTGARKKNGSAAAAPSQQLRVQITTSEKWICSFPAAPDQPVRPRPGPCGPVEEEDVVGAGQSLQQDLLLRDGLGRVELHPDELPHVLVHQADAVAVDDVSDVGRNPVNTGGTVTAGDQSQPPTGDQSGSKQSHASCDQERHYRRPMGGHTPLAGGGCV